MNKEFSETLALQALAWVAADEDVLGGFLGQTGLDINDLRTRAAEPDFLGAVLDYILSADQMVLGLATALNIAPETVVSARAALPGGDSPHWT